MNEVVKGFRLIGPVLAAKVMAFEQAFPKLCGKLQLYAGTHFACVRDVACIRAQKVPWGVICLKSSSIQRMLDHVLEGYIPPSDVNERIVFVAVSMNGKGGLCIRRHGHSDRFIEQTGLYMKDLVSPGFQSFERIGARTHSFAKGDSQFTGSRFNISAMDGKDGNNRIPVISDDAVIEEFLFIICKLGEICVASRSHGDPPVFVV